MQTIDEIREVLSTIPTGSVVFIDVDDTIITPASALFRSSSPYKNFIDELKKNREQYPHFETILSRWRLQRNIRLVSPGWVELLHDLKQQHLVYALTKMETGPFGEIPSMEKWRYDELTAMGIYFTPTFAGNSKQILLKGEKPHSATFYQGIFITGSYTKGEVVKAFFDKHIPRQLMFIDDRHEHIQDVKDVCEEYEIPCAGILYAEAGSLEGAPDPKVAEFQISHLLEQAEWLEDEIAMKLSPSNK